VSLGSKVSVVEMTNGLLPGADRDLVSVLKRRLDTKFAGFRLETKVAGLKEKKNGIEVTFETAKGEQSVETFDKVLISIGQRPNTADLGLETTAIKLDERRFVVVDGQRRTSEPNIFAIGDIAGEPTMAHKSPP
jgi:dihydrolipoamide dehydrogenase